MKEHSELAVLIMATSTNPILKGQLIFTCGVRKEKGKKCGFLKSAQFPPNSANAKNLKAWNRVESKKVAKDNTAIKAALSYHMQEAKKGVYERKKRKTKLIFFF